MHQSLFSRRLKEWKKVELLLLPRRRRRGASVAPYAPRYSYCCCPIPTMNTQRLSYIAQFHKTFRAAVEWLNYRPDLHSKHNGVNNILKSQLNFCMQLAVPGSVIYQNDLAQIIHIMQL